MKIPTLAFNTETEFRQRMSEYAHQIHTCTLYGIKRANDKGYDHVTVAYLNHDDVLAIPRDAWMDNLEMTLEYFEIEEDYLKCQEVSDLIEVLK